MLNALEPGTKLAIHRHTKSSETVVCLEGCFTGGLHKRCGESLYLQLDLLHEIARIAKILNG